MTPESRQAFMELIKAAASELNMDWRDIKSCSPGLKALAAMYWETGKHPDLLIAYEADLTKHDFGQLASPDAPDKFVWVLRQSGTWLITIDGHQAVKWLEAIVSTQGDTAHYYTFDGDRLREESWQTCRNFLVDEGQKLERSKRRERMAA